VQLLQSQPIAKYREETYCLDSDHTVISITHDTKLLPIEDAGDCRLIEYLSANVRVILEKEKHVFLVFSFGLDSFHRFFDSSDNRIFGQGLFFDHYEWQENFCSPEKLKCVCQVVIKDLKAGWKVASGDDGSVKLCLKRKRHLRHEEILIVLLARKCGGLEFAKRIICYCNLVDGDEVCLEVNKEDKAKFFDIFEIEI
jgi:hypothetical protein